MSFYGGRREFLGCSLLIIAVFLAGCSYVPYSLHLDIESTEPSDEGYLIDYNVTAANNGDFTFHEVSVHGYAPNGTSLCEDSVGAVRSEESKTGRLNCTGFPQVIAVDAAESDADTDNPSGVRIPIYRYAGYNQTDDHRWKYLRERETTELDGEYRNEPLPPERTLFERVKCQQRVAVENVSVLGETPWMTADVGEPTIERTYRVYLVNATGERAESHGLRLEHRSEVIESLVREYERQNRSNDSRNEWVIEDLTRSKWQETLRAVGGENVTNVTDFPAGTVDRHRGDSRREICWNGGGDFGGELSLSAEYVVILDDRAYYLRFRYVEEWE